MEDAWESLIRLHVSVTVDQDSIHGWHVPAVCPPLSDPIIERKCFILEQLHSLDIKRCKWALIYLAIKVQCGSFILYFWWLWPLSPASCWFLCFLFLLQKASPPQLGPPYSNSLHLSHISASLNPPQSKGRTMVLSLLIILTNENECINFRYDTAVLRCCIFINSWAGYLTLNLFIFFLTYWDVPLKSPLPPPPSQVPIAFTALLETYIFNWRHAMWRQSEKNVLLKLYKCKTCMRLKGEVRLTLWCVPWILRRQWQFPCKSWALCTTKVNNKCEAFTLLSQRSAACMAGFFTVHKTKLVFLWPKTVSFF